jgi:hypothetical protein
MAINPPKRQVPKAESSVIQWLLDSDPSIRWQTMRDLTGAPDEQLAAERARVATEGWGARLLARQEANGRWGGDPDNPEWTCLLSLLWLRDLGLDPSSTEAQRAVELIRDNVTWHWWDNKPFFEGEVEPCINGRVVSVGSYFGEDVQGLVDRLLGEQMDDGGWNCEQENGSTRGSFHTTICVLEGLLEHEQATGGSPAVTAARERGQEFLLERRLLHRLSTGEVIDPAWTQLSFPTGYHYDVLRGLEYLRRARVSRDERMTEAIDLVIQKRGQDGRWSLENPHPEQLDLGMDEAEGKPSRWNTLRALRVLGWYSAEEARP